ncbi:MAG: DUF2846 domain-containing protein [Saprospiraceae bacterium]
MALNRSFRNHSIFLVLVYLIVGCKPTQLSQSELEGIRNLQPPVGKSLIYIVRPSLVGGAISTRLTCDGKKLGSTHSRQFVYAIVSPGWHRLVSHEEPVNEIVLFTEPGKAYFVQQRVKMGMVMAQFDLIGVKEEEGRAMLNRCKLSPSSSHYDVEFAQYLSDSDYDGTPNDKDECPDSYGPPIYQGCPDTDGDGIANNRDRCPHEWGTSNEGCPLSKGPQFDKDFDGVNDDADKCPDNYGSPKHHGCPDTDDDGVPDYADKCPLEKGPPATGGCPANPMPQFPWPPPQCFLRQTLVGNLATQATTFSQVDTRLQRALDTRGYTQRSYFHVPGGFAIVTQLEQFDEEGQIKERCRWVDYPVQEGFDGVWDYLTSLVMPSSGHFRIFVFVVTNQPYTQAERKASKEEATGWLAQGVNRLPSAMSKSEVTGEHYLDVLIYEFEAPQSTRKCAQKCPCLLDCQTHLTKSGLFNLGF